jgi:hypothetical protein
MVLIGLFLNFGQLGQKIRNRLENNSNPDYPGGDKFVCIRIIRLSGLAK